MVKNKIATYTPFWRTGPARCVLVIVVAVVLAQMVGCKPTTSDSSNEAEDLFIYRDRATGCEYVATTSNNGITPRMDRDGKQVCALVGAK